MGGREKQAKRGSGPERSRFLQWGMIKSVGSKRRKPWVDRRGEAKRPSRWIYLRNPFTRSHWSSERIDDSLSLFSFVSPCRADRWRENARAHVGESFLGKFQVQENFFSFNHFQMKWRKLKFFICIALSMPERVKYFWFELDKSMWIAISSMRRTSCTRVLFI